jgi:hypothetical protein
VASSDVLPKTELLWSYTPTDLVEPGTPSIATDLGEWTLKDGTATCALTAPVDPVDERTKQVAREELSRLLLIRGAQVDRVFGLVPHPTIRQHSEFGISHTITGGTGLLALSSTMKGEAVVRNAAGDVLSDSGMQRRERDSQAMVELNAKIRDSETLRAMHESYARALGQPASEFVHLFEIVELLEKYDRGDSKAQDALKVAAAARKALGTLANSAPVSEGRHNGCRVGQLRPATPDEKMRARKAAKDLMRAFADRQ